MNPAAPGVVGVNPDSSAGIEEQIVPGAVAVVSQPGDERWPFRSGRSDPEPLGHIKGQKAAIATNVRIRSGTIQQHGCNPVGFGSGHQQRPLNVIIGIANILCLHSLVLSRVLATSAAASSASFSSPSERTAGFPRRVPGRPNFRTSPVEQWGKFDTFHRC